MSHEWVSVQLELDDVSLTGATLVGIATLTTYVHMKICTWHVVYVPNAS